MGDWDVVSTTPAQGARPAGEWDVISTAPARIRVPRRGGSAAGARPSTPAPPPRTGNNRPPGMIRSALQGAQDSVMNVLGGVPGMLNPGEAGANAVNDAAGVTDNIANLIRAAGRRGPQPAPPVAVPQGAARSGERTVGMARNALLDTQPTNAGERFAYFLGGAAPFAGMPGAVAPKALGLGGGVVGGWGAGETARFLNAPDYMTSGAEALGALVGGIVGGAASGFRRTPGGPAPTGIDPANPLRPVDAARAAEYARRQIPDAPAPTAPNVEARGMTTAERSGTRAQNALGALARRAGTTTDELQGRLDARRADRSARIQNDVQRATGVAPGEAAANVEALVQAGRERVAPMFRAVENDPTPVVSPRLTALSETPVIQRALRQAYEDLANNPDGPQAGAVFREGPNGMTVAEPTMAAWDKVYKALQGQVERNQFTGRPLSDKVSPQNANINRARAALRNELGRLSPNWDMAMRQAGEYVPIEQAYRSGNDQVLAQNVTEANVQATIERLSPGELNGYRAGIANRVFDLAQNNKLSPRILSTPRVRAKLEIALGKEAAQELIDAVSSEAAMAAFEQRYGSQSGSVTSPMQAAMAEQDAFGGSPAMDAAVGVAADAVSTGSLRRAVFNWLGTQAAKGVATLKTRGLSEAARNEAGRLLGGDMSPAEVKAYAEAVRRQAAASRPRLTYVPPQGLNMLALPGPQQQTSPKTRK